MELDGFHADFSLVQWKQGIPLDKYWVNLTAKQRENLDVQLILSTNQMLKFRQIIDRHKSEKPSYNKRNEGGSLIKFREIFVDWNWFLGAAVVDGFCDENVEADA